MHNRKIDGRLTTLAAFVMNVAIVAMAADVLANPVTLLDNYRQDRTTSFACPGAKPDLWPDGTKWSSGAAPDKNHDYVVTGNLLLTTMEITYSHFTAAGISSTNFAFRGNSLTLGEVGKTLGHLYFNSHGLMSHGFDNAGLILANGEIRQAYNGQNCDVYGKLTVTAPAKAPFSIRSTPASGGSNTLRFMGPLLGDSGTAIRYQPKPEYEKSILSFLGDWSGFAGVLEVTQGNLSLGGTRTMPGGVKVSGSGRFAANGVTDVIGLGTFEFNNGGTLDIHSPSSANVVPGYIKVCGEYLQSGTPVINFVDNPKFVFGNSTTFCRKLINMPAAAAENLNPENFVLSGLGDTYSASFGVSLKKVRESDGTFSLCLAARTFDAVRQIKNETTTAGAHNIDYGTVLTNETAWSSGIAPTEAGDDARYLSSGYAINAPWSNGSAGVVDFTFPGAEWTLGTGSRVHLWGSIHRMNNFHFLAGSGVTVFGYSRTVYGNWFLNEDDAAGIVSLDANWSVGHWIYANISGRGTFNVGVPPSGNNTMPKTYLMGDNSAFVGRLTTSMTSGKTEAFSYPTEDHHLILYAKDGKSLGGNPAALLSDGILLKDYTMLSTYREDVVLDAVNRGVTISGTAGFVAVTNLIAVKSPVVLAGTLVKQGEGALALGGTLTTSAGNNNIRVQQGSLVAMSKDCLTGSAVVFETGTKLGVVANASDTEFTAKGFVNTCDSAVTVAGDRLVVSVELPASIVQEWKPYRQAICTLPTQVAKAIYNKVVIQHVRRYSAKKSLVGQGTDMSSIVVDFAPSGSVLIVR